MQIVELVNSLNEMDLFRALVGFAILLVIIALVVVIRGERKLAKAVKEAEREAERQGVVSVRKVVGYGWVMERVDDNNYVLHQVRLTSDGWAVSDKAGKSWLVRGIKPQYVEVRRYFVKRLVPLWIADRNGNILDVRVEDGEVRAQAKTLPPELSYSIINSKLLSKVARVVAQDHSLLMYGMMLGLGLAVLVILVVLPAMGIPVQIGAKPINVRVELPSQPLYSLPPPGNYTPTPG